MSPRRLLVAVDVQGYGTRTGGMHSALHRGLLDALNLAADSAGLDRPAWSRQGTGDGELAVLPVTEPETQVIESFLPRFAGALRGHNQLSSAEAQLRVRLAVHYGVALPGPFGHTGAGPVVVARLCGSRPLRQVLKASRTNLAVILSDRVFTDTVSEQLTDSLEPRQFRKVRVREKEFDADGWLWIPDGSTNVHDLVLDDPPDDEHDEHDGHDTVQGQPEACGESGRETWSSFRGATITGGVAIGRDQHHHGGNHERRGE
ncbi:MAG: hypothetical protein ABIS86_18010 [Streptosporangiaceae bacterium]